MLRRALALKGVGDDTVGRVPSIASNASPSHEDRPTEASHTLAQCAVSGGEEQPTNGSRLGRQPVAKFQWAVT